MAIIVTCECGKKLSVADELAGRRGKCPACGLIFQIPAADSPAPKPSVLEALRSHQPQAKVPTLQAPGTMTPLAPVVAPLGESPFRAGAPVGVNPYQPSPYPGQGFGPPGPGPMPANAHQLSAFPVPLLLILNFVTINIFVSIWLLLMHGKMPKLRHDDPSAGKAIGFCFIPLFNIFYWSFFVYHRLVTRINEQRMMRGLPPTQLQTFAIILCSLLIVTIVPLVGIPFSVLTGLILFPIFASLLQTSVNELVEVTAAGSISEAARRRICLRHARIFRLTWGAFLGVIGLLFAMLFVATYIHGLVGETDDPMPLVGLVAALVMFSLPFLIPGGILLWLAQRSKAEMVALAV